MFAMLIIKMKMRTLPSVFTSFLVILYSFLFSILLYLFVSTECIYIQ